MTLEKSLTLKVYTPNGLIHSIEDLSCINVPLANGYPISIHPGHAPLIAGTIQGPIRFRRGHQETAVSFHAGILKIRNNEVIIFTAGESSQDNMVKTIPEKTEYDRLMETLVTKLQNGLTNK